MRDSKPSYISESILKHSQNCQELHFNLTSIQIEYNNSIGYILNKVNDKQNEKLENMKFDEQLKKELIELYNNAITTNGAKFSVNRKMSSGPILRSNCKIYIFSNTRKTVSLLFIILGHAGILFKIKMKFHSSGDTVISFFNCSKMRLTLSFKCALLNTPQTLIMANQ
jgi:ribosomal protein L33